MLEYIFILCLCIFIYILTVLQKLNDLKNDRYNNLDNDIYINNKQLYIIILLIVICYFYLNSKLSDAKV